MSSGWFGMIAAGREVGCSRTAPHLCIKTVHTLLTLKACVLRRFAVSTLRHSHTPYRGASVTLEVEEVRYG